MKTMRGLRIASVFLALASLPAHAEDARFVLSFGAQAGAPLPHSYSYGKLPQDTSTLLMRVPVVDAKLRSVLADTELTIETATNLVTRVHAERAYISLNDCTAGRDILNAKLAELMPTPLTAHDRGWHFQSADGKSVGGAVCRLARHLPYPVLVFEMSPAP